MAMDYIQIEDAVPASAKDKAAEADETAEQTGSGTETHKNMLLVGRDRWTTAVLLFVLQSKGIGDGTIVDKVARWVDALGYRKVVLKTDGEPALVAVQQAVAKARTH